MKKHFFLFATLSFAAFAAKAQNTFPASGNVGIGTSSPTIKLQINGSNERMSIGDGTGSLTIGQWDGVNNRIESSGRSLFLTTYSGAINLGVSGSTNLSIANSGNVGIGTLSPYANAKLQVKVGANQNLGFQPSISTSGLQLNAYTDDASVNVPLEFRASSFTFGAGNVGIGTASPYSNAKLQVKVGTNQNIGFQPSTSTSGLLLNAYNDDASVNIPLELKASLFSLGTGSNERLRITAEGNTGINTSTPPVFGNYGVLALNGRSGSQGGYFSLMTNGTEVGSIVANSQFNLQAASGVITQFYTGGNPTMQIAANGNVGVGTNNPDQKLSVAGIIHAQAVKVDMTGWSDYVFKPHYNLRSLAETKAFIDKNHHLPDMPSEKEVIKNGVDLGQMNKILLQKIEELTLHLLEIKKQNSTLSKRVGKLETSKSFIQPY